MSITLITGRSDRGITSKSKRIYEEIKRHHEMGLKKLFLIVPEQYTLGAEQALIDCLQVSGLMDIEVLSFKRLEYRVFSEVGGVPSTFVDEHGVQMLLRKCVDSLKEELTAYKKSAHRQGFLENISELISEFKQSEIMPGDLLAVYGKLPETGLLKSKLEDIVKIYTAFENLLGCDRLDPDDKKSMLAKKIPCAEFLKEAFIWIDGFFTFSVQDYQIIQALSQMAKGITLSLTYDENRMSNDNSVFRITNATFDKLYEMAAETGQKFSVAKVSELCAENNAMDYLAKEFFSYNPKPYAEVPKGISILQSKNPWSEVEDAAEKIAALVREDHIRYKDIVVMTGDLENYGSLIKRVFTQYQIPFYLDEVEKVADNPLVAALISGLYTVADYYKYDDLFAYVKTGFSGISEEEADILENTVLEYGIKGGGFEKDWNIKENSEEINTLRKKLMSPLVNLKDKTKKSATYKEMTTYTYEFLEEIKAEHTLDAIIEDMQRQGDYHKSGTYQQIWNLLMDIFDQIVKTMGNDNATLEEYISVLEGGLFSYTLGNIPEKRDAVQITDLLRSRNAGMDTLLVLGVNEGILPKQIDTSGLLSEKERSWLNHADIILQNSKSYLVGMEEFIIYQAFTSPAKQLHLFYAMASLEGEALGVSPLIHRLKDTFPLVEVKSAVTPCDPMCKISTVSGTFAQLASKGLIYGEVRNAAIEWFLKNKSYTKENKMLKMAENYQGICDSLQSNHVKELYKMPIETSISRLEKYRKCAFSHFVQYGLRPIKREEYTITPPDIGVVVHSIFDTIFKETLGKGMAPDAITEDMVEKLIDKSLKEILKSTKNNIFESSGSFKYLGRKIKRVSKKSLGVLLNHLRSGSFTFMDSEHPFIQKLELPKFGEEIKIRGVIDRIDVYTKEKETFVKVIDFKTGNKNVVYSELYYGISLQLLVYMKAGIEELQRKVDGTVIPGGSFYFHVDDPMVEMRTLTPELLTAEINRAFILSGLYLDDAGFIAAMDKEVDKKSEIISLGSKKSRLSLEEFNGLMGYVEETIVGLSEEIIGGNISIIPIKLKEYIPCNYCDFRPVCQWDNTLGNKYEVLNSDISREMLMKKAGVVKEVTENAMDSGSTDSHNLKG